MATWLALALMLAPAAAEEAEGVRLSLVNGGTMEGALISLTESEVGIEVDGGTAALPRWSVARIDSAPNAHAEHRARAARTDPNDAAAHWRLAREASRRGLSGYAALAARRTLALDPEHAAARAHLGFERRGGAWLTADEAKRARGLVEFRGEWVKPAHRDARLAAETFSVSRAVALPPPIVVWATLVTQVVAHPLALPLRPPPSVPLPPAERARAELSRRLRHPVIDFSHSRVMAYR